MDASMSSFGHGELAADADRDAVAAWMWRWIGPIADGLDPEHAQTKMAATSGAYGQRGAAMEGVTRALWGIVPYLAGGGQTPLVDKWRRAIEVGVDPKHAWSWGTPGEHDQRWVESCILGVSLAWTPQHFWEPLDKRTRDLLAAWLARINDNKISANNWLFFRVLVNVGLMKVGRAHDAARMRADLDLIDSFYLGDGWYSDGATEQRDYYIPTGMHFYGLLYAMFMADDDPQRASLYRERAAAFVDDYARWYASDGGALAYGRSLTYRFVGAAFWAALALADVPGVDWGIVRGIYSRNLAWWSRRPIAGAGGGLSIGFGYPNLNMAEQYNAPGSPGWAFKAFTSLALPREHPFWSAIAKPLPHDEAPKAQPHARLIVQRVAGEARCLCAGQWPGYFMRAAASKYAKFAYSSALAFSVPVAMDQVRDFAPDNTIAVSEDGLAWRMRGPTEDHQFGACWCAGSWRPWKDVTIRSWLIARGPWHVRIHRVTSGRALRLVEGGWSIPRYDDPHRTTSDAANALGGAAVARGDGWVSVITSDDLDRKPDVVRTSPNTNLIHPRAVLPVLMSEHEPGEAWLTSATWAGHEPPAVPWPAVSREGDGVVTVRAAGEKDFVLKLV